MDFSNIKEALRENRSIKWMMENEGVISIIGYAIFILAIVLCVIWFFQGTDSKLEPVVVIMTILSSLLVAAPRGIRSIFLDKPIYKMSYEEILQFIESTDPHEDWDGMTYNFGRIHEKFLKADAKLRLKIDHQGEGVQSEDYCDEWANSFLHKGATGYYCEIIYDRAHIKREILVAVDEGQCLMPPPEVKDAQITKRVLKRKYVIAKIFDTHGHLEEYMERVGFIVE